MSRNKKRTKAKALTRKARRAPSQLKRGYNAGKTSELLQDFLGSTASPFEELRNLKRMRGRSRDLSHNNDYAKNAFRLIKNNVVGWEGFRIQMQAVNGKGELDVSDNDLIKKTFLMWGEKDTASVDGKFSWVEAQHLFIETVARDGECLVRKLAFDNEFGFSLQFIDIDHLEVDFNKDLKNGNKIRMSIEFNSWGRPVAYHILDQHPGDINIQGQKRIRVPAGEIIHEFIADRPNQPRGVPWLHSAINRLQMLGGYEDAELVASRVASAKMGFYTKPLGEGPYQGDDEDSEGNPIQEVEPGSFEVLPQGWDVKPFDPQHPNSSFKEFVKTMLRGVASGIGISYNALSNDLESVNYSSMRSGKLDERDSWKCIQSWMAKSFCQQVFSGGTVNFLAMAMLSGPLSVLPFHKWEKFNKATWRPRGWEWVDPDKEVKAHKAEIDAGFTSHTRVLAKRGIDFRELLEEIVEEKALMKKLGVSFAPPENEPALQTTSEKPDDDSDKTKKD